MRGARGPAARRPRRAARLVPALCLLFAGACGARVAVLSHDENLAAASAAEFAHTAYVERDYERALGLLTDRVRDITSRKQLQDDVESMHSEGFPTRVWIVDFEPMPGRPLMTLYGEGENDTSHRYYSFVVDGTKSRGYTVAGFWHQLQPFPPDPLRQPLEAPVSFTPS